MKVRLLNVSQVKWTHADQPQGTVVHEYRPNCVEITIGESATTLLMLSLIGDLDEATEVILIGRVHYDRRCVVVDPLSPTGDGCSWELHTPSGVVLIRPYKDETIFVDPSYGRDLPKDLEDLYASLRRSRGVLILHTRLWKQSAEVPSIASMHETAIKTIAHTIRRIEGMIAAKEVKHAGDHHPD